MARVKVTKDLGRIPGRLEQMTKRGQYALVNQVHADMDPYVPRLSSDLANQSTIAIDGKSIIYHVPYARRRFYEPASRYTTPGTGPRWDKKAAAIHGDSWARVAKAAMK